MKVILTLTRISIKVMIINNVLGANLTKDLEVKKKNVRGGDCYIIFHVEIKY